MPMNIVIGSVSINRTHDSSQNQKCEKIWVIVCRMTEAVACSVPILGDNDIIL